MRVIFHCFGHIFFILTLFFTYNDENQQAPLKDPLHVLVGPITRARSMKIKEALNGLIQNIWADSKYLG